MKNRALIILGYSAILFIAFLSGCVTPGEATPEWITGIAPEHPEGTRIVAYGRSPNRSDAIDAARIDAQRQVERILASAAEDTDIVLTEAVTVQIEEIVFRRTEALEQLERFIRSDDLDFYEVYLLLLYRDEELARDLREIDPRFPGETTDLPEAETVSVDVFTRLQAVLDQSVPLGTSARTGALTDALSIVSEVAVSAQPTELTVPLGEVTDRVVTVSASDRAGTEPLTGIRFSVQIVGPEVDGNRTEARLEFVTGDDGTFTIVLPEPRYSGTMLITAEPTWFSSVYDRWASELQSGESLDRLDAVANRLRGRTAVRVTSRAPEIPTAVVILDRDIAGNPMSETDALSGVLRELGVRGFRVRRVDLGEVERVRLARLERIEVSDLYDIFPFEVLASVDRAIVGDARILEFNEDEGFSAGVEIGAVAFDLRRDQRLASVTVTERISGSSAQATIRAAFQEAGRRLARQLAPQLP